MSLWRTSRKTAKNKVVGIEESQHQERKEAVAWLVACPDVALRRRSWSDAQAFALPILNVMAADIHKSENNSPMVSLDIAVAVAVTGILLLNYLKFFRMLPYFLHFRRIPVEHYWWLLESARVDPFAAGAKVESWQQRQAPFLRPLLV